MLDPVQLSSACCQRDVEQDQALRRLGRTSVQAVSNKAETSIGCIVKSIIP